MRSSRFAFHIPSPLEGEGQGEGCIRHIYYMWENLSKLLAGLAPLRVLLSTAGRRRDKRRNHR